MLLTVRFWFFASSLTFVALLAGHFYFGLHLKEFWWWTDLFGVLVNLLTGALISFLFYFLVVLLPEKRKREIIKGNLTKSYLDIKRDILWQVVFASIKGGRTDLTTNVAEVDKLMNVDEFRSAFQNGREANEGFYAFQNQMDERTSEFREIVLNLRFLSQQIDYVLHNYPIDDQKIFDFFKRLELFLMRLQQIEPGYDESKVLCRFIYEIFAGFNRIEGDRGYDIVQKMIHDI